MRKNLKKVIAIALLAAFLPVGCANKNQSNSEQKQQVEQKEEKTQDNKVAKNNDEAKKENKKEKEESNNKKSSYPLTIIDDMKNEVKLDKKPEKIAAISGTYLGILYAAGGESIARADSNGGSPLPEGTESLESVGAVYNVDIEKVVSLNPDLVIAQFGLQNRVVPALQQSNIPVVSLNMRTYDDVVEKLKLMGKITENEEKVEKIIEGMETDKKVILDKLPEKSKKVAILYVTSKEVSLKLDNSIAGNVANMLKLENIAAGTKAQGMGGENVPFSMEKIVESDPDVILVTTMVGSREQAEATMKKELESNPIWKELRAVKEGKIEFLPQSHFLYNPGEKFVEGIEFMARAVYPEVYGNVDEMDLK